MQSFRGRGLRESDWLIFDWQDPAANTDNSYNSGVEVVRLGKYPTHPVGRRLIVAGKLDL